MDRRFMASCYAHARKSKMAKMPHISLWTRLSHPARVSKTRYLGVVLLLGLAFGACQGTDVDIPRCKNIPSGGCPDRAGVDDCLDRACTQLYRCNADQRWTPTTVCVGNGDAAVADASTSETSVARDANIDAPPGAGGGPGCGDLTLPDCTLLYALACPQDCCSCEDVFVCASGGWNHWGTCTAGTLTPAK
jgi:hypothetical protein